MHRHKKPKTTMLQRKASAGLAPGPRHFLQLGWKGQLQELERLRGKSVPPASAKKKPVKPTHAAPKYPSHRDWYHGER